jgi:hypothetical protein
MLLRARTKPDQRERFAKWFRAVHLHDVERIPGVAGVTSGRTPGGTHLGFYAFESAETVQLALQSAEAAYARGTWEQWAPHMEEMSIEIWAPLVVLPIYHSRT